MSNKEQAQNQGAPAQDQNKKAQKQENNNVISFNVHKCAMEDCKSKPQKSHFCDEHYAWFKFGVISKEGKKPKDFDKKLQAYNNFAASKAA